MSNPKTRLLDEIRRRRTFGIISHPDAGKTTLTEKFLLFGGAIQMAGAVKARKAQRHATSDWMAIEKERGISVTSAVMKFEYRDYEINLLDTPGHEDFSEDTYRVLSAVDSAVMVIDGVKGVEPQTRKLMEVCRLRNTPILTFINKFDRECRDPLELLQDIEESLQIETAPMTWPIGMGKLFRGAYDLNRRELRLFRAGDDTVAMDAPLARELDDPELDRILGSQADELREEVELLDGAANPFDLDEFLAGNQTPVFFGSAINNFGVRELLDTFVEIAPHPGPRPTVTRPVEPDEENFSGFVFKIQANMDPAHRDRLAFLRVCSGKFERGMKVRHHRIEKEIAISNPLIFMAQSRQRVEEAWPGDIIGIHNHGTLKIGDTLTANKEKLKFTGIPNFAPEHFRRVRNLTPMKSKQLQKGLTQLAEEGAVQLFRPVMGSDLLLGAVGMLQFDVAVARLASEYSVEASYEGVRWNCARWVVCHDDKVLADFERAKQANCAHDVEGNLVYLDESEWLLKFVVDEWPDIRFTTSCEHA